MSHAPCLTAHRVEVRRRRRLLKFGLLAGTFGRARDTETVGVTAINSACGANAAEMAACVIAATTARIIIVTWRPWRTYLIRLKNTIFTI